MDLTWEVVAGADKGGILVRTGRDTKSPEYPQRLAFGAVVRQIEMHGDRMNFQKISGDGPAIGWVSVRLKDKELLKLQVPATRAERDQSRKQLQQALQFSPHMKAQAQVYFTALDAADAEEDARGASRPAPAPAPVAKAPAAAAPVARKPAPKVAAAPPVATAPVARAPVAKAPASKPKVQDKAAGDPLAALREELESMKLKEIKAKAREAGFTEEDIEEAEEEERPKVALIDLILKKKAAEAPQQLPSMDELEAGMDDGDDEIIDAPAPAPARSAPVQSVPAEAKGKGGKDRGKGGNSSSGGKEMADFRVTPSSEGAEPMYSPPSRSSAATPASSFGPLDITRCVQISELGRGVLIIRIVAASELRCAERCVDEGGQHERVNRQQLAAFVVARVGREAHRTETVLDGRHHQLVWNSQPFRFYVDFEEEDQCTLQLELFEEGRELPLASTDIAIPLLARGRVLRRRERVVGDHEEAVLDIEACFIDQSEARRSPTEMPGSDGYNSGGTGGSGTGGGGRPATMSHSAGGLAAAVATASESASADGHKLHEMMDARLTQGGGMSSTAVPVSVTSVQRDASPGRGGNGTPPRPRRTPSVGAGLGLAASSRAEDGDVDASLYFIRAGTVVATGGWSHDDHKAFQRIFGSCQGNRHMMQLLQARFESRSRDDLLQHITWYQTYVQQREDDLWPDDDHNAAEEAEPEPAANQAPPPASPPMAVGMDNGESTSSSWVELTQNTFATDVDWTRGYHLHGNRPTLESLALSESTEGGTPADGRISQLQARSTIQEQEDVSYLVHSVEQVDSTLSDGNWSP